MPAMTKARAAAVLAAFGDGDTGEIGEAIAVAVKALTPAPRKAAKAKTHPSVAAFLKLRFPAGTTKFPYEEGAALAAADAKLTPAARIHFAYGTKHRVVDDAAVVFAAGGGATLYDDVPVA